MSEVYEDCIHQWSSLDDFWSCIHSFIGPYKSVKVVNNCDSTSMVSCVAEYLGQIPLQNPLSGLICSSIRSHHDTYGCGCASMLAMVYFWHRCLIKCQSQEEIEIDLLFPALEQCLENVIYLLNPVTTFLSFKAQSHLQCHVRNCTSDCSPNTYTSHSKLDTFHSLDGSSSNHFLRTSRHFAKSYHCPNESDSSVQSKSYPSSHHEILDFITEIVEKLSHGNTFVSNLIVDVWKMQMAENNSPSDSTNTFLRFDLTQLTTICSVSSTSNSKVLRGLLLKADCDTVAVVNRFCNRSLRTVLVKGNVTPNFMHKGVNLKIKIDAVISSGVYRDCKYTLWMSEVYNTLKKLDITLVVVSGKVDDSLVLQLLSAKIATLQNVGASTLEIIANATGASIASYVTDCDVLNVINGVSATVDFDTMAILCCKQYSYIRLQFPEEFQTVVICHPVNDYVACLEHSFWHTAHRLTNVINYDKMLPGYGIVEEFIATLPRPVSFCDTMQNVAWFVITTGFKDFADIIRRKSAACYSACQTTVENGVLKGNEPVLDDYIGKIESWRAALRLSFVILKTDLMIITGESIKSDMQTTRQQLFLGCL